MTSRMDSLPDRFVERNVVARVILAFHASLLAWTGDDRDRAWVAAIGRGMLREACYRSSGSARFGSGPNGLDRGKGSKRNCNAGSRCAPRREPAQSASRADCADRTAAVTPRARQARRRRCRARRTRRSPPAARRRRWPGASRGPRPAARCRRCRGHRTRRRRHWAWCRRCRASRSRRPGPAARRRRWNGTSRRPRRQAARRARRRGRGRTVRVCGCDLTVSTSPPRAGFHRKRSDSTKRFFGRGVTDRAPRANAARQRPQSGSASDCSTSPPAS